jgi:hypothetical protein
MAKIAMKWSIFLLFVLSFVSCKPQLPDGILSQGEMEDILYDYHLAQTMTDNSSNRSIDQRTYEDAVLRKYDVKQDQFDASLAYYMRYTEQLQKIYEHVSDRLKDEAESLGASASDYNKYGSLTSKGDTADIWAGAKSVMLMMQAPFNQSSFSFKTDSTFHTGDQIMLNFDSNFIFQDGMRDGCVVLAVTFKNDSVATNMNHLSASNHYSLNISDYGHLGIKEIKGYFILNKPQSNFESSTTLQLMFINNIQLIRMHENKKQAQEQRRNDSISAANAKNVPVPNPSANPPVNVLPPAKLGGPNGGGIPMKPTGNSAKMVK